MPAIESELLETGTTYCDVADVERRMEGETFDSSSEPTDTEVESLITEASATIDARSDRAWRERKVSDWRTDPNFSHKQRSVNSRRRYSRAKTVPNLQTVEDWVLVNLPHLHIREIDSGNGDVVKLLRPRDEEDITGNKGRDSDYVVDTRRGQIRIHLSKFRRIGRAPTGYSSPEDTRISVTYRFGQTSIPADITRACSLMVAAELLRNDHYSDLAPAMDDTVSPEQAASSYEETAFDILSDYRNNVNLQ